MAQNDNSLERQMLARAMELQALDEKTKPFAPKREPAPTVSKPFSPRTALLMGSLADSASTAAFLAQGRQEGNPALGFLNKKPWMIAPAAAGGALGYHLLHKLISKKAPKLADTLAGGIGAYHMALAGNNLEPDNNQMSWETGTEDLRLGKK